MHAVCCNSISLSITLIASETYALLKSFGRMAVETSHLAQDIPDAYTYDHALIPRSMARIRSLRKELQHRSSFAIGLVQLRGRLRHPFKQSFRIWKAFIRCRLCAARLAMAVDSSSSSSPFTAYIKADIHQVLSKSELIINSATSAVALWSRCRPTPMRACSNDPCYCDKHCVPSSSVYATLTRRMVRIFAVRDISSSNCYMPGTVFCDMAWECHSTRYLLETHQAHVQLPR